MSFEDNVKSSFKKAKEDAEGIKNELAFALKRIAKIEELMTKHAIENLTRSTKSKKKK